MSKKAHIILTKPVTPFSQGSLNSALADITKSHLTQKGHTFSLTDVLQGYDKNKEHTLWKESDYIIYHFPLWWFSYPNQLKKYMDEIYSYEVFFGPSSGIEYGTNGYLKDKQYLVVITANAPKEAFQKGGVFEGMTIDDVMVDFHLAQKYLGMTHKATYIANNVVKGDTSNIPKEYENFLINQKI